MMCLTDFVCLWRTTLRAWKKAEHRNMRHFLDAHSSCMSFNRICISMMSMMSYVSDHSDTLKRELLKASCFFLAIGEGDMCSGDAFIGT